VMNVRRCMCSLPEGNTLPHRDAALCSTAKAIAEWSKWVKSGHWAVA